ncbi:hypothetical protein YC2023_098722 [Brassica napus]
MSRTTRRSLQNLGREPGQSGQSGETRLIALMRELRKGIHLKFWNRDVAVDGNVRESGDIGGNSRKKVGSSGWKSTARRVVSGAFPAALENPEDQVPLTPGRTHNRIRSPSRQNGSVTSGNGLPLTAGLGGPSSEPVDCGRLLEPLTWRERRASCRLGDGLGTTLSGAFPGRRTANSELVRTRGIRLFN